MRITRWSALGRIAIKRFASNRWLSACLLAGVAVTVAISMAIPIYAGSASARLLLKELSLLTHPPFGFLYRYPGESAGLADWERLRGVDEYLLTAAPAALKLPLVLGTRYLNTDRFETFAAAGSRYVPGSMLGWMGVGSLSGIERRIVIAEGRFPRIAQSADAAIEALVTLETAEKLGLQVGEGCILIASQQRGRIVEKVELPVVVSGVWVPRDRTDPFWFYPVESFNDTLLVPEESFHHFIASRLERPLYGATWHLLFEDPALDPQRVPRLLRDIRLLEAKLASIDADVTAVYSPEEALERQQRGAATLLVLLCVFGVPVLGLQLQFIVLISTMIVQRQANEIALLRSRGSARIDIALLFLIGALTLGACGTALGAGLGPLLGKLMSGARSFLRFDLHGPSPVWISWLSVSFGLAGAAASTAVTLVPALGASRYTIVTSPQRRARSGQRPFWQRAYLDVLLLIPLGYGCFALWRRGTLALAEAGEVVGDPFSNPILFLVPTLFVFSLALLFLRLFPPLTEALARLGRSLRGAPLHLAMRALSRSSGHHDGPLLLLVLTVGLASFTSSMARTLDAHIVDSVYYRTGDDILLAEPGQMRGGEFGAPESTTIPEKTPGERADPERSRYWEFMPIFEYTRLPGVARALRVGHYTVSVPSLGPGREGTIVGIDPGEFRDVSSFRADYSPLPLELIAVTLAARPSAILVDRRQYDLERLATGDTMRLNVSLGGGWKEIDFVVAGVLEYFPTVFPEEGPLFLANLAYLFDEAGGMYSYNIWLSTEAQLGAPQLEATMRERGLTALIQGDARELVDAEYARPDRQGFYGLLSAGFAAAAILTALGFLMHFLLSFQRRSIEMGVLRSIGMSTPQMIGALAGEQLAIVAAGMSAGTLLGVSASHLFIPFLQMGSDRHPFTPPLVVRIAWADIGAMLLVFVGMLSVVVAVLVLLLRRMQLFEAVKLGEAI